MGGPAGVHDALSTLVFYTRPGCHLCDEARSAVGRILAQRAGSNRAVPQVVERDITTDPALERRFLVEIPVIEIAGRRLTLATSPRQIERLLDEALDG